MLISSLSASDSKHVRGNKFHYCDYLFPLPCFHYIQKAFRSKCFADVLLNNPCRYVKIIFGANFNQFNQLFAKKPVLPCSPAKQNARYPKGCVFLREYLLYDLGVRSEIPFPEAPPLPGHRQVDVTVRRGGLSIDPRSHPDVIYHDDQKLWYSCLPDKDRYLFNTIVGAFELIGGSKIVVDLLPDADDDSVKAFTLGSAFGILQMQRGRIPIHGASIAFPGGTLIVTGDRGAGKSTITDAIVSKGYRYLSDDVSPLSLHNGIFHVHPSYPQRKLCRDACLAGGYDLDKLVWINEDRDKFAVRRGHEWHNSPLPLGWMVEIVPDDVGAARVETVHGHDKLRFLFTNIYRSWALRAIGIPPHKMKTLMALTSGTPMYRIYRPKTIGAIPMVLDLIWKLTGSAEGKDK